MFRPVIHPRPHLRVVVLVDHTLHLAEQHLAMVELRLQVALLAVVELVVALAGGKMVDVHPPCPQVLARRFPLTILFRGTSWRILPIPTKRGTSKLNRCNALEIGGLVSN